MQCLDTTCNVIEDGPSLSRLEAMIEHSLSEVNVSPPTGSSPRCVRMKCCCGCCCCRLVRHVNAQTDIPIPLVFTVFPLLVVPISVQSVFPAPPNWQFSPAEIIGVYPAFAAVSAEPSGFTVCPVCRLPLPERSCPGHSDPVPKKHQCFLVLHPIARASMPEP